MRILGVDPGTNMMGYAVIDSNKEIEIIISGKLNISAVENPYSKLQKIHERISAITKEYKPDVMSIEAPFFAKNVQSMLKLGRAQGVAIAAAFQLGVDVFEYSPRKVKQAVTGNGNASKEQIAQMLRSILKLKKMPDTFDETDAIAIALCHYYQNNKIQTKKSYSGWADFVNQNPRKIKK